MSGIRINPRLAADLADSEDVRRACLEKAQRGAEFAKGVAPVDTGAYRDSIRAEEAEGGAAIIAGGGSVDYAGYIEVGTSDTPAFHVLGQAGAALEHL